MTALVTDPAPGHAPTGAHRERQAAGRPRGRLVAVSNRLPCTFQEADGEIVKKPSSGGLVAALDPALRARGGLWIGWPGIELPDESRLDDDDAEYRMASVPLDADEVRSYYDGFCNRALWPLLHGFPDRMHVDPDQWQVYDTVNRRFARVTEAASRRGDAIWIQDYHLMRAAHHLRRRDPDAMIGFFLHVPFPAREVFGLLPWAREILAGLAACDLVGFQSAEHARQFVEALERHLGARTLADETVRVRDRRLRVGAFPIGIDVARQRALALESPALPRAGEERILLGVDRLDYTKGIPERIRAYERFLVTHPGYHERVVLLQLVVPSRTGVPEYRRLKQDIDREVGRVNGRFATCRWSPIRMLYRSVPPERLAAMYRDAEVALVTPLRDGMNLVAKEFVAAQTGDPGVLVLSHMAGAAAAMREALSVNPYDVDELAESIHRALTMARPERARRIEAMQRRQAASDVHGWADGFMEALREAPEVGSRGPVPRRGGGPPARFPAFGTVPASPHAPNRAG